MTHIKFDLKDIPQANDLTKVGMVVIAVSQNTVTFQEIASYIALTPRQGRYYRRAAEILGLIETKEKNHSQLTSTGRNFLEHYNENHDILTAILPSLLSIPLLREVYDRVAHKSNVDETEILNSLIDLTGIKKRNATIIRRLSTFTNWLKQVKLLQQTNEDKNKTKTYRLLPIVIPSCGATRISLEEGQFLDSMLPYLYVPKRDEHINWERILLEYESLKEENERIVWLNESDLHCRLARYIIGISSKEKIKIEQLDKNIKELKNIEFSHTRLLIERERSLKFVAKSITKGGAELEQFIDNWLTRHKVSFKRAELLKGSSKNVDFFLNDLNIAIESKFSKTSGSKHGGAISDINEIAKNKNFNKTLLLGVVMGGTGFEDGFFNSLQELYNAKLLDFILPVSELANTIPNKILRMKEFKAPNSKSFEFANTIGMSWTAPLDEGEQALYDSVFWFEKYSNLSYLNFDSKLQAWLNQTPFGLHCLRLVLGWSETQMHNFILNVIPQGIELLRNKEIDSDKISLLVTMLKHYVAQDEIDEIEKFFDAEPSTNDFIVARIEAFDGVARKKHNTSKIFIDICKDVLPENVIDIQTEISLQGAINIQSHFSIKIPEVGLKHVHCRYYSGDGSVMSDFVKKVDFLSQTPEAKDWIIIIDGSGWKKRIQDFRRLLAIAKDTGMTVLNYRIWKENFAARRLQA